MENNSKPIDPGNEFSGPNNKKLADLIAWIRRQPDANLRTGEGKLLVDEIDRLTKELVESRETAVRWMNHYDRAMKGASMT